MNILFFCSYQLIRKLDPNQRQKIFFLYLLVIGLFWVMHYLQNENLSRIANHIYWY